MKKSLCWSFVWISAAALATTLSTASVVRPLSLHAPPQSLRTFPITDEVGMKDAVMNFEQGLPPGNWGGEHISLEVTTTGGNVEFDCAHGTLTQRIVPDRLGRFDVTGTYEEEHGGPLRAGQAARSIAVRYAGEVKAGRMTLKIRRRANRKLIGTFTLKQGAEALLVKCR